MRLGSLIYFLYQAITPCITMARACTNYTIYRPLDWGGVSRKSRLQLGAGRPSSPYRRWGKAVNSTQWVVRAAEEQNEATAKQISSVDVEEKVRFLYDDLRHPFDDQGIDRTAYDEQIKFRDPITKYDSIGGYLFNIAMLRALFSPDVQLHWVKQTGPYEITTRWTVLMRFALLPWKPELVLTGTSVMGLDPQTGKFCSHLDYWDSIKNNEYFSMEGVMDLLKQSSIVPVFFAPELESPKFQILKRAIDYEIRKYSPFIVVETKGEKLSGSTGFNSVASYIFGKNSATEKIPITTPVFTETIDPEASKVAIQIVPPQQKDLNSLPTPNEETVSLREVEGGVAAVLKFSEKLGERERIESKSFKRWAETQKGISTCNIQ